MNLIKIPHLKVRMTKNTISSKTNEKIEKTVAIAGNPNVGKSTVFNALTGLRQHTGNWPGKTVACATGNYTYKNTNFNLVDIPGTYSLLSNSAEEEIARDFICFGKPDAVIVVLDATCIERNLNLALQILELTEKVIVCVNLIDEANRKKIYIDLDELSLQLGVPVIATNARSKKGLKELMECVRKVCFNETKLYKINTDYGKDLESSISKIKLNLDKLKNEATYWKFSDWFKELFDIESDRDVLQMHMTLRHFQERSRVPKFYKYDNRKKIVSVPSLYVQNDKDAFNAYKYREFMSHFISKDDSPFYWQYIDHMTLLRDK